MLQDQLGSHPDSAHATSIRVLRQFRIVFNAVRNHFREVERVAGIGGAQLWALSTIKATPNCNVSDLTTALDIHQSTASNLVKGLVTRGLVHVSRDTSDRRAVVLDTTADGEKILSTAPGPFSGILPDALASLDPAILARLEQDLSTLITALDADLSLAHKPLATS